MSVLYIRKEDDEVLRKVSEKVSKIDKEIIKLLEDMKDTMYKAEGVGLAAPQVGVLKRVAIVDIGEGLIELINPLIVYESGEQTEEEGCLSIPGINKNVRRPYKVIVRATNRKGQHFEIAATELLARAFCHEIDHLNGILFTDKVVED